MSPDVSTAAGEPFEMSRSKSSPTDGGYGRSRNRHQSLPRHLGPELRPRRRDLSRLRRRALQLHERARDRCRAGAATHRRPRRAGGDRVAVAMRNYPEWVFSFWAAASLGAVVVPLNAWWTGPELAYGLADSGTRVILADGERSNDSSLIWARRTSSPPSSPGPSSCRPARTPGVTCVGAGRSSYELPALEVRPDDDATIMYTSGTTGRPKGAVGTNRNVGNHIMNAMYARRRVARSSAAPPAGPPVTLLTFPLFHVGGLQSFLLPYTVIGGNDRAAVPSGIPPGARRSIEREERQHRRGRADDDVRVARRREAAGQGLHRSPGSRRARRSCRPSSSGASTRSSRTGGARATVTGSRRRRARRSPTPAATTSPIRTASASRSHR